MDKIHPYIRIMLGTLLVVPMLYQTLILDIPKNILILALSIFYIIGWSLCFIGYNWIQTGDIFDSGEKRKKL